MNNVFLFFVTALMITGCAGVQNRETPYRNTWVEPIYSEDHLKSCIEGYVIASLDISQSGRVSNVDIVESFPKGLFDAAATDALEKGTYYPAVKDGKK